MSESKEISTDQFVQLVLRHEWRVRAFVATMLGRPQNIEDVVQEIFTVAWAKREQFSFATEEPDEEFVRWVCTIGRYESLKNRRQQAGVGLLLEDSTIERLVSFQFEESAYLESRRRALAGCIDKLRDVDRLLVRRRYSVEQAIEQIAAQDGKTVSTIYKSLTRIRTALLACVGRTLKQEGF